MILGAWVGFCIGFRVWAEPAPAYKVQSSRQPAAVNSVNAMNSWRVGGT